MEKLEFVLAEMCFSGPMGHLPIIVLDLSKDGEIVRANDYAVKVLGRNFSYGSRELDAFLIPPWSFKEIREEIERGAELAGSDLKLISEDGSRTAIWLAGTVREEQGQVGGYLLILYDLTEKLRLQQVIAHSRDKLRMVFDAMDDLVMGLDLSGRIITANMAVARWKAMDIRQVIGLTCQDIVGASCSRLPEVNAPNRCPITRVLEDRTTYRFRQALIDHRGVEHWFAGRANPVFNEGKLVQIALQFSPTD